MEDCDLCCINNMKDKNSNIAVLELKNFPVLLELLSQKGYDLYGPTIDNDSIVYDKIQTVENFPIGWKDRQDAGSYRLEKSNKETLFGFTVGSHSWKKLLHPANERLWKATADGDRFSIKTPEEDSCKLAFIGVRPCELQAMIIQDKIFTKGSYVDTRYQNRRKNVFIVAVNCTQPGGTCFCASMKTGPKAQSGFDLCLTEIVESDRHYFTIEAGSKLGKKLLNDLPAQEATRAEIEVADKALESSEQKMGRTLDTEGIKDLLHNNFDNSYWEKIAERCLTCGNCTMVCPTCFCVNVEDTTDLTGQQAERWSRWDSCFTTDFSYIHGGSIRTSATSRYRQWMMHKLSYWVEQFGTLGCVGCGRCITWCPAKIDITEEAEIIRKK